MWKRSMGWLLGHRQTKGAATDNASPTPPRHISTPPWARLLRRPKSDRLLVLAEAGRRARSTPLLAARLRRGSFAPPLRRCGPFDPRLRVALAQKGEFHASRNAGASCARVSIDYGRRRARQRARTQRRA